MPLLYRWRGDNYRQDLDLGVGYHLNQANPLLHMIELGDSVWAFTRARNGSYALAAIQTAIHMGPVVAAFQAMRGVGLVTATTMVAEAGDIRRFEQPPRRPEVLSKRNLVDLS